MPSWPRRLPVPLQWGLVSIDKETWRAPEAQLEAGLQWGLVLIDEETARQPSRCALLERLQWGLVLIDEQARPPAGPPGIRPKGFDGASS